MSERMLRNLTERRLYYPNPQLWRRLKLRWWPALLTFLLLASAMAPRTETPRPPLMSAAR